MPPHTVGSQSVLVHPPSSSPAAGTTSLLDSRLRDSGSSSGSNGSLLMGGLLQQRNNHSNASIASDPVRKSPQKTSSFSPSIARRLAHDSAPILPDRMRDHRGGNIGNSSTSTATTPPTSTNTKRRFSSFRAAEKGKGDILPTHTAHNIPPRSSSTSQPLRSRAKSQGSFASSKSSSKLFSSPTAELIQDRSTSLRSRRSKHSIRQLQQQQSYRGSHHDDDCNASDHSHHEQQHGTYSKNSWSDESDAGSNNGHHHSQHSNHSHYSQQHKQYPMKRYHDPSSYLLGCGSGGGSGNRGKRYYGNQNTLWLNMKPVQFITVMLLLAVTCFVAGSYHKVLSTTEILKEVKHEESLLLLHLQRVEQASLQLHENLSRLNDRSSSSNGKSNTNNQENAQQQQQQQAPNNGGNSVQVDSDLIRIQTEKLREMEAELDHEVRALQKKIQTSARRAIIENYGEGAVQVYLDLYNPEDEEEDGSNEEGSNDVSDSADASSMHGKNRIAIRLWYDTPHSAWTFLKQVSTGQWNGAVFDWDPTTTGGRSILARSVNAGLGDHDSDGTTSKSQKGQAAAAKLEPELHFVEQSQRGHERYTIGLTDSGILINLQDNRDFYKHEACVGTIINGFDVLHRVIRQAQRGEHPVRIKRALVSHLTARPEKMS